MRRCRPVTGLGRGHGTRAPLFRRSKVVPAGRHLRYQLYALDRRRLSDFDEALVRQGVQE